MDGTRREFQSRGVRRRHTCTAIVRLVGVGAVAMGIAAAGVAAGTACMTSNDHLVEVQNHACYTCHVADYDGASDPPHVGAMPTTCADCHTQTAWRPALDGGHPEDRFPVTGGPHGGIACADCHDFSRGTSVGGRNADCVGCHTGDHERAQMDARHAGLAGYPTGAAEPSFCLTCHPSGNADTTPHPESAFPIATGAHQPFACFDCHNPTLGAAANGQNTDCVGCHTSAHERTAMDARHLGVSGYPTGPAEASFCLTCHPNGTADDALHPETSFPIATGPHAGLVCADCHDASLGSSVGGANTNCVGCHSGEHERVAMDAVHVGVSSYPTGPAAPNFCLTCHPSGSAEGAGHPDNLFRISSGRHSGIACNGCHNAALGPDAGGANADCVGCHSGEHSASRIDWQHSGVSGYSADYAHPNFCLECHRHG